MSLSEKLKRGRRETHASNEPREVKFDSEPRKRECEGAVTQVQVDVYRSRVSVVVSLIEGGRREERREIGVLL